MSARRIYAVEYRLDKPTARQLVRASTATQALNHVKRGIFVVKVADQETLVDALAQGVRVEDAVDDGASTPRPAHQPQQENPDAV